MLGARVLLVSFLGLAAAASAASERAALVDEVLRVSGATRQFEPLAEQLARQLLAQEHEAAPGLNRLLADAARREFAAAKLLADIRSQMLAELDEAKARLALAWLGTEVGQRIVAAEGEAAKQGGLEATQAFAKTLQESPPSAQRTALTQRISAATNASETNLDVVIAMARASALALNAASKTPVLESDVIAAVERQRTQLRAPIANLVTVEMLRTYRTTTDDDLTRYAEFLETAHGRWYARAGSRATLVAVEKATRRMVAAAAARLQPTPETQAL